jgi:hypothetical protein
MEKNRAVPAANDPASTATRFPWLEWVLLLAGQAMFFQAFPVTWDRFQSIAGRAIRSTMFFIDMRHWNLAGYLGVMTVVLAILLGLKVWKDRVTWNADVKRWLANRRRF